MIRTSRTALFFGLTLCAASACSNDDGGGDYVARSTLGVKNYVNGELEALTNAAADIQKAAPEPDDDGWNDDKDKKAVNDMRAAWKKARTAYEHIEGSIAVLFMGLDVSTDERYDGFIEEEADDNLFDDAGVVGVHAIERILWAGQAPERVVKFESALPGYKAAAFPSSKTEADEFKNKLSKRLVDDTAKMRDDFEATALRADTAFRGMIGSMQEQSEKTTKAASGEDESRYAQTTLDDMRANFAGAHAVYDEFKAWIQATSDKSTTIEARFKTISDAYAKVQGPALPEVPATFDPEDPSEDDLKTPYGLLWKLLEGETDPDSADSLVSVMNTAADDMKIPELADE
jgi:iron uptake system component EfeO